MTKNTKINKLEYLQYAFFMDKSDNIFPCDAAAQNFINSTNFKIFYSHLLYIKINSAITSSTVNIDNNIYNMNLIPINSLDNLFLPKHFDPKYMITLFNQTLFSSIIHSLNQYEFNESKFDNIFANLPNGIFVTDKNSKIVYINKEYEELTSLVFSEIKGKDLSEMEAKGILTPLITPTILENSSCLTALQSINSKRHAIISGFPIYDIAGKPIIVVTCINVVTHLFYKSDAPFYSFKEDTQSLNLPNMIASGNLNIIAESQEMQSVIEEAIKVAPYPIPILILGDSGTGKEIIASIIHSSSGRRKEPFVKINCSSISPALLESELFGYESGAFTGASNKGKVGLFEHADKGTLLLDEIGDLPIELQVKLLRVLQDGMFYKIGGLNPIKVDVRIIACTNKNPQKMIYEGTFREDLLYRLNTISIRIPPLRNRKEDIKPLLIHFSYLCNVQYGTNKVFSPELISLLENYFWPGNVRELEHLVTRLIISCNENILTPEHFYSKYHYEYQASLNKLDKTKNPLNEIPHLKEAVAQLETKLLMRALREAKNTRSAATLLGVSQSTIMRKIKDLNIRSLELTNGNPSESDTYKSFES